MTLTASLGVAQHITDRSLDHLIDRADTALYSAKAKGRDRSIAATDSTST